MPGTLDQFGTMDAAQPLMATVLVPQTVLGPVTFVQSPQVPTPTNPNDAANKVYVDTFLAGFVWLNPVINSIDMTTAEPPAPVLGDRYINTVTGVMNVTLQACTATHIYQWNGVNWTDYTPVDNDTVFNQTDGRVYHFHSGSWSVVLGPISHNALINLIAPADDHTQYLNINGVRQMAANLGMAGFNIVNANTIQSQTLLPLVLSTLDTNQDIFLNPNGLGQVNIGGTSPTIRSATGLLIQADANDVQLISGDTAQVSLGRTFGHVEWALGAGDNDVKAIYDDGTYIWMATNTVPARLIRVTKANPTLQISYSLSVGEDSCIAINDDGTYIWMALSTSPGQIARVPKAGWPLAPASHMTYSLNVGENLPSDMTNDGTDLFVSLYLSPGAVSRIPMVGWPLAPASHMTYTFSATQNLARCVSAVGADIWVGLDLNPGKYEKVPKAGWPLAPGSHTNYNTIGISAPNPVKLYDDGLGTYLWVVCDWPAPAVIFTRLDKSNPSSPALTRRATNNTVGPGRDVVSDGTYFYIACNSSPAAVWKIPVVWGSIISSETYTLTAGQNGCNSLAYDGSYIWLGTETSPSELARIDNTTVDYPERISFNRWDVGNARHIQAASGESLTLQTPDYQKDIVLSPAMGGTVQACNTLTPWGPNFSYQWTAPRSRTFKIIDDGTYIWAMWYYGGGVTRFDKSDLTIYTDYPFGAGEVNQGAQDMVDDGTYLWVAGGGSLGQGLTRVTKANPLVRTSWAFGTGFTSIIDDGVDLWCGRGDTPPNPTGLYRILKANPAVWSVYMTNVGETTIKSMYDDGTDIWCAMANSANFLRVPKAGWPLAPGSHTTYPLATPSYNGGGLVFDGTDFWLPNSSSGVGILTRVNYVNPLIQTTYSSPSGTRELVFDGTKFWACSGFVGSQGGVIWSYPLSDPTDQSIFYFGPNFLSGTAIELDSTDTNFVWMGFDTNQICHVPKVGRVLNASGAIDMNGNCIHNVDTIYSASPLTLTALGTGGVILTSAAGKYLQFPSMATPNYPATPVNGMMLYDSTLNQFTVRENGSWVQLQTSASAGVFLRLNGLDTMGGNLQMAANEITATAYHIGTIGPYGRPEIQFFESTMAPAYGVLRMGSCASDGDPIDVDSDGMVTYAPSGNYLNRIKANRFGLTRCTDSSLYYWRVDDTQFFFKKNDLSKTWLNISNSTGDTTVGGTVDMNGGAGMWFRPPTMTNADEIAMTAAWTPADNGKMWFNSTSRQWKGWTHNGVVGTIVVIG